MRSIYHYISKKNWERAQKSGVLLPKSDPCPILGTPQEVYDFVDDRKFLVGLPTANPEGWVEFGLMPYLLGHTKAGLILKVPVLDKTHSFVREHAHYSPKRCLELYGKDLFGIIFSGREDDFSPQEHFEADKQERRYLSDFVPLNSYRSNYRAPEVWLSQITPVRLIQTIPLERTMGRKRVLSAPPSVR